MIMQISAEIRWFWSESAPHGLQDWFCNATPTYCKAGGGTRPHPDRCLITQGQSELGLKHRDNQAGVEVKGLVVDSLGELTAFPFAGQIEMWTKWLCKSLDLNSHSTIPTSKLRWLRKFKTEKDILPEEIELDEKEGVLNRGALPMRGCNVELTQITLDDNDIWWTFGFESFGTVETVKSDLETVAGILVARKPPSLGNAILSSYPGWLDRYVGIHV
jgi:hypothetical protein